MAKHQNNIPTRGTKAYTTYRRTAVQAVKESTKSLLEVSADTKVPYQTLRLWCKADMEPRVYAKVVARGYAKRGRYAKRNDFLNELLSSVPTAEEYANPRRVLCFRRKAVPNYQLIFERGQPELKVYYHKTNGTIRIVAQGPVEVVRN